LQIITALEHFALNLMTVVEFAGQFGVARVIHFSFSCKEDASLS
jgi:hypothetical protein